MMNTKKELDLEKLPTLGDVLLVEKTIQDCDESIVPLSQLKILLHGKITQNTLWNILDYLDEKNKITTSSKGVTWIKHTKKLLEYMDELLKNSELTEEDTIRLGRKVSRKVAKRFRDYQKENTTKKKNEKKNRRRKTRTTKQSNQRRCRRI